MAHNSKEEPKTGPQPDRWYNLTLGSSFKDETSNNSNNKYCTLRYEFKPASIDKTKAGTLSKNKENRVSVEFQNNQLGKPKVTFEGSCEDYKENDAVLFFDGHSFRLERLHRAFKQLRHLRLPGESAAASSSLSAAATSSADPLPPPPPPPRSSPPLVGKGVKPAHVPRPTPSFPPVPVEVERIDVASDSQIQGVKVASKGISEQRPDVSNVNVYFPSPKNNDEAEDHIDIEDIFGSSSPYDNAPEEEKGDDGGFDINVPNQNETDDDEIADVDDSGDEVHKGRNAAEALRAQVNAEERDEQTSSSSSSSGSGSSGSGSGSGSSEDSDGSEDSVNSI